MSVRQVLKRVAGRGGIGGYLLMPFRFMLACRYYWPRFRHIAVWTWRSREFTNFTYEYTSRSLAYLGHTLAVVTGRPAAEIAAYVAEAQGDGVLIKSIQLRHEAAGGGIMDRPVRLGRQLAWYVLVRAARPRRVVETGVARGLSAVLISRALARNAEQGEPGEYIGIDLDPQAGALLGPDDRAIARVITGDSVATLNSLSDPVDLFISDSHVSPELELAECRAVEPKLSARAIVATTYSSMLPQFAQETGRHALVFREEPKDHWYPGGWLGFAFSARREPPTC